MRILFIIIVVGALGYLGWVFRDELTGKIQAGTASEGTLPAAEVAPAAPPAVGEPPAAPDAPPLPKEMAPAGSFYVKQRVSVEMPTGVKALNAGELVKVMYRNKDGTARVTTGKDELIVKESLLTTDPAEIGQ